LLRAFAPVDKRALGVAVGIVAGLALFAITAFHVVFRPVNALRLELLNQYFDGYNVSWRGAAVGLCWGFLTGFIAGWFLAFTRNLVMAMMVFTFKIKGDLANTRDFLDHS
jgi:tetrahydromethanopterin S-methyltransferase subunit G